MLKLITPPSKKAASKVEDPKSIITEAIEINSMIADGSVYIPGSKYNECFAVAQPQVSMNHLRYFVINPKWKDLVEIFEGEVIVNPKLVSKDRKTRLMSREGCLSWPFRSERKVKRFNSIKVNYVIINNKGRISNVENKILTGLPAIVFQHELDHLNGKTIWDK